MKLFVIFSDDFVLCIFCSGMECFLYYVDTCPDLLDIPSIGDYVNYISEQLEQNC